MSLYEYVPVFSFRDRVGDWVIKRTGLVHSSGPVLQSDVVGDEHGGSAPAYKHHLLAQFVAQGIGDRLQHCEELALQAHARAILSSNLSWASFNPR